MPEAYRKITDNDEGLLCEGGAAHIAELDGGEPVIAGKEIADDDEAVSGGDEAAAGELGLSGLDGALRVLIQREKEGMDAPKLLELPANLDRGREGEDGGGGGAQIGGEAGHEAGAGEDEEI